MLSVPMFIKVIFEWIKNINALTATQDWFPILVDSNLENWMWITFILIMYLALRFFIIAFKRIFKADIKQEESCDRRISLERVLGIWVNSSKEYNTGDMLDKYYEALLNCESGDILPYEIFIFMNFVREGKITLYAHKLLQAEGIELSPIPNEIYNEFNLSSKNRWKDNFKNLCDNDYKLRYVNISVIEQELSNLIKRAVK